MSLTGDKTKKEIIPNYYSLYKYAFKGNKVFVVYSPAYNITYGALFEDGALKWKHTIKKSYLDIQAIQFVNSEVDSVIMLEYINSTFEVHIFEETFSTEYGIKSLRNMTFQYPHLIYAFGTREVWLQDLNNNVKIYYFDGSITGMENSSNVKHDSKNYIKLGLALDFGDYLRIGDFEPRKFFLILTIT